jgi:hypothetical protein
MKLRNENPLIIELKQNLTLQHQNMFDSETLNKFLKSNHNSLE